MRASLTVVIPSRSMDGLLAFCIRDLHAAAGECPGLRYQVVVIDNGSPNPTPAALARSCDFHLIRLDRHHSFAAACNLGVAAAPADHVLLLNNDVLLARGALCELLSAFEDEPRLGICGARMVFPDRTIQHAGVVFGAGPVGPYHHSRGVPSAQVARVPTRFQAATGACLMIRSSVLEVSGGLDEAYPFGLEDIDLCLRAGQRGYAVRCVQETESLHFESRTPGRSELDRPSRELFMSRWAGRYTVDG